MMLSIKNNISQYLYLPILMAAFIAGNAVLDLCVILSSIYWLIYKRSNYKKYSIFFRRFIFIFVIFYISILTSSFFSDYSDYSLPKSFVFFRYILFALFIFDFFIFKIENYRNFIKIIPIFLCLIYLDVIIQIIFNFDLFGNNALKIGRYSGPFGKELILGTFIFIFSSFYTLSLKKFNLNFFLFLGITFIFIILSGERVALIKFILFNLSFFSYYMFKNKIMINIKLIILFLFSLITIIYLLFNNNFMERHKQFYDKLFPGTTEFILYSGHYTHFVSATKIFIEKPILGSGYRTFRKECAKHQNFFKPENIYQFEIFTKKDQDFLLKKMNQNMCSTHPHNLYFEILSETGLFGFISFLILIVYVFIKINSYDLRIFLFIYLFPFLSTGAIFHGKNSLIFTLVIIHLLLIKYSRLKTLEPKKNVHN